MFDCVIKWRNYEMNKRKQIFIISDLHLCGCLDEQGPGQILNVNKSNNVYSRLTEFINWVNEEARKFNGNTEIIINGDFFDFIADNDLKNPLFNAKIWTPDENEVINKLSNMIVYQSKIGGPINALGDFVGNGHELTIILGNHDVELSFPGVRRYLLGILRSNRGIINFIFDGESYVNGGLLVEHGNRYDRWNMINHSALRQERSMVSRGLPVDERKRGRRFFLPPPGTFLVIHIINRLKNRYKFIDLLKPELGAVVPMILALEPDSSSAISCIMQSFKMSKNYLRNKLAYPAEPSYDGNLGGEPSHAEYGYEPYMLSDLLVEELGYENATLFPVEDDDYSLLGGPETIKVFLAQFLESAYEKLGSGKNNAIEWCKNNFKEIFNDFRLKRINIALQRLSNDNSFNINSENANYLEAAKRISQCGNFQAVVFGHTHLPKKVSLDNTTGNATYLNSGAWVDIMEIPKTIIREDDAGLEALRNFVDAVRKNDFAEYIKRYLSYVEVLLESDGSVVFADLFSYCGAGMERMPPLTDINK